MDENQSKLEAKANKNKMGEIPILKVMKTKPICLRANFSIKTTIETFKIHKISGAPVVDDNRQIIGIVSEYDLLIQAAAKNLNSPIEFNKNILSVRPNTSLKDVLILLYKHKLKRLPVVDDNKVVVGSVSRIDVLAYIAENEPSI